MKIMIKMTFVSLVILVAFLLINSNVNNQQVKTQTNLNSKNHSLYSFKIENKNPAIVNKLITSKEKELEQTKRTLKIKK
ncbi:hypothetical protein EDC24_1869 [Aquisalibacillus elongatus]|uniref:Uncharacterized protein n=1 Tax=Aquisalibacillus elongatus TaxID=485577 RepID=A0A3N5BDF8_9BACI|nr:hypothetical protein EDC24_1869 [Aquisalibacillus elongatus]